MSIGANILAPWVADRAAMYDWLVRANPRSVVVCDEPNVAAQVKAALPKARVIHRWVREGDGSIANWTPQAWVRDFVLPLPPGVMGYVLNEPGGDWRAVASYLVTVMRLVAPLNIPLVLGNFSKGQPPRSAVDGGELDEFLLAFNDFPINFLGYHPYFADDPATDEHASWHTVFLNRAAKIGAKVRLIATEAGRDERGGYHDGYRVHMPSISFAEKLTRQARTLDEFGIDMAPFCYGTGGPIKVLGVEVHHWENFNFEDDPVVKGAIVTHNAGDQIVEVDDMVPGYVKAKTRQAGVNVRVRLGPGLKYAPVTTVKTGDWVKRLPGSTINADGYTWAQVAVDKTADSHVHGWCALEVIEVG